MTKVSDLVNIKDGKPLLVYRQQWPSTWRDEVKATVLHISTKRGTKNDNPCYFITNCNRAMEHADHWNKSVVPEHEDYYPGFRLCTRCGSDEDFDAALAEYHCQSKQWERGYKARRAAEEAQREVNNAECEAALSEITDWLRELPEYYQLVDETAYHVGITDGKFRFTVTVSKERADDP